MDNATTTAKALDVTQPVTAVRQKKHARKARAPKLHKPKKESTKTITTRLYKTWSAIVHASYGNKCAVCGKPNSKEAPLNAHHIMPRQMFSGLRFDPLNGISLCPKCHKLGKFSAHKGGIWFAWWLQNNQVDKYNYCLNRRDRELDCKDRLQLYSVEDSLHDSKHVEPLTNYKIVAYDKKGNKVESVVHAYNKRAAEYIFWYNWPEGEGYEKLKGIHKTEETEEPACL